MTDLLTLYSLAIQTVSAGGLVLLILMSMFSNYIRPFVSDTFSNMGLWVRGRWSIRTDGPWPPPPKVVKTVEPLN